jgi:hypothetical protein
VLEEDEMADEDSIERVLAETMGKTTVLGGTDPTGALKDVKFLIESGEIDAEESQLVVVTDTMWFGGVELFKELLLEFEDTYLLSVGPPAEWAIDMKNSGYPIRLYIEVAPGKFIEAVRPF